MNPCQSCGACCASFRVTFHSAELDAFAGGCVPSGLTEQITADQACMRGTAAAPFRCVALHGTIGAAVSCAIYEFRPEVCREFSPLAAIGVGEAGCDSARRRHGLPPL